MTILNNTVTDSTVAISLGTSSVIMAYNNILNYTQNSLILSEVSTAVNATYNWWGTTDTQAINLTIRDFKYDITLGTVTFVPLLTAQNPQAPSTSFSLPMPPMTPTTVIPEFPSLTLLAVFLVVTSFLVVVKKRVLPQTQRR